MSNPYPDPVARQTFQAIHTKKDLLNNFIHITKLYIRLKMNQMQLRRKSNINQQVLYAVILLQWICFFPNFFMT